MYITLSVRYCHPITQFYNMDWLIIELCYYCNSLLCVEQMIFHRIQILRPKGGQIRGFIIFFSSPDFFQQPFEILIPNLIYAFSKGRESSSLNFIANGSFCSLICFNSSKNNTDLLLIGHVRLNLKFDINIFIEEIAFENVCENSTIVSQLQRETSSGD